MSSRGPLFLLLLFAVSVQAALVPPEQVFFAEDAVHEIHLTFHQPDWWNLLRPNFEGQEDPLYLPAEFDWEAVHFDSIGVRFKGNSSYYSYPGVKKSFKLDIDEYIVDQEIDGLDKLNLNNGFLDPSFVREKCAYELCEAAGLPAERTNYAALYINGEYWGLYTLVEQYDQQFIESRFGSTEEGNLWKGDPHGSLEYRGPDQAAYYNNYELKTNEEENDWSALVDFVHRLNNTPLAALPDSLHNATDVSSALAMLAIDLFTVNLDSYIGRCANYYFYHRDLDDRMIFAKWDLNEAWGVFNAWNYSLTQMTQLSPFWVNPQPNEERPLAERLWQVPAYEDIYVGHIQRLMAGAAEPDRLVARMEALRDLIRPYVLTDTNKMFTNVQFENALTSNIYNGPRIIPALETFVRNRDTYLRGQIGTWTPIEGLVINELMASNSGTIADEHGDFDDWIEIANVSAAPIELSGLGLCDHHDGSTVYLFPDTTLQVGEYLIVWADEEIVQGPLHAPFKLDADGEDLYLIDGAVIVDQVTFPTLPGDVSFGRWPDGTGTWQILSAATPGAENANPEQPEEVVLFINEFLALNDTNIQDETGAYEDWVEIYNPGPDAVEMGGLFLTDDLALTTQWMFPDTLLAAGDFLIVWGDDDPDDGPLHATFKLSGDGEEIGLYGRLAAGNVRIDSYAFGPQSTDVSEGRESDGGANWIFFQTPTPGATNQTGAVVPDPNAGLAWRVRLFPQPLPGDALLSVQLQQGAGVLMHADLYDLGGRRVRDLLAGRRLSGSHLALQWDGRDDAGRPVSEGLYFLRIGGTAGASRHRVMVIR